MIRFALTSVSFSEAFSYHESDMPGRGFEIDLMRVRRRLRPVAPGETAIDRYELSSGDELVPRYEEIAPGDWRLDTRNAVYPRGVYA